MAQHSSTVRNPRRVESLVDGQATSDGAGVKLTRVLTSNLQRRLDPFLMLDAFRSDDPDDYIGGFPEHPHRGFETVTYMLAGRMRHRDSAGNEGLLQPGGVQWMTAGRGILHSEMPEQQDGLMEGFQLWVNLPAELKMTEPGYRDIPSDEIPEVVVSEGTSVRVIAGDVCGITGAVARSAADTLFLDVHLPAGARFEQPIPAGHNAFLYVYRGGVLVGDPARAVGVRQMGVLETGEGADGVVVTCTEPSRLILLAGRPLREPIVQYGPFVMNTREQIMQAVEDYNRGRLA